MHLPLDMIRRTDDGVLISSPRGEVLLKRSREGITAEYLSGPLVNGTSTAFDENAKSALLNYASEIELPWTRSHVGSIKINDHERFYEQTFSGPTYALETLNRWSQK